MRVGDSFASIVALLLAVRAPLSCIATPTDLPTYQIFIPADGLAEDARYDFILEAEETLQIVDRTPGFQALIEPTSFSVEAFAYEDPDCDVSRKIKYRRAFVQAKPTHVFWRRDVKRDLIDGRKYTFSNPPEGELDALNPVEFCIVVTAPSPVPESIDPNVAFRRRLQGVPEPDEHTLTLVIHSAALSTCRHLPFLTAGVFAVTLALMPL